MRKKTFLLTAVLLCCLEACRQTPVPPASPTPDRQPPVANPATTVAATPPRSEPPAETPQCTSGEATLCPVDEGESDPSFAKYRQQLRSAVERRDVDALVKLVDPQIRTSFGESGGIASFRKLLTDTSSSAQIWQELSHAIALGGTFRGEGADRMFWAPYVYSAWPEKFDSFVHMAAVRAAVPVRERPSPTAPVVTSIDWAIVELVPDTSRDTDWRHVRTIDDRTGWVEDKDLRSPIGYRAGFRSVNGEWKMNAFVAGD